MTTLVAHEWLEPHGGAEAVVEQILQAVPSPRLTCLWNDAPQRFGTAVEESWLSHTPLRRRKWAAAPLFPLAWRGVRLCDVERVVASSHAFAHQLASRAADRGIPSFAYIHTPARYVWAPEFDPRGSSRAVRAAAAALQMQDRRSASSKVSYVANSMFVRRRIATSWHREAGVIYPPVAVEDLQAVADWSAELTPAETEIFENLPDRFVLGASRLVAYKRLDLAMAVGQVLQLPVVIAGGGPHQGMLESQARRISVPVHFVGRVSDALLRALYQRAVLFAFLAVEDFGIMPVEAMALGTPVLVNEVGGSIESVTRIGGGSSVSVTAGPGHLRERALEALRADPEEMRKNAEYFSHEQFRKRIKNWMSL